MACAGRGKASFPEAGPPPQMHLVGYPPGDVGGLPPGAVGSERPVGDASGCPPAGSASSWNQPIL